MAKAIVRGWRFCDLAGQTFGRWLVLRLIEADRGLRWLCRCQCGTEREVSGGHLKSGASESCGCITREVTSERNRTHGKSESREYEIWCGIKKRCHDKKCTRYSDYGGRGIKVCDRWLHSFENFLADMGPCPSKKHSIDRFPDNDGNYEPGNCRWATGLEQGRNCRRNRVMTWSGKSQCIAAWSEEIGIDAKTIQRRLGLGWSDEEALTTSIGSVRHKR